MASNQQTHTCATAAAYTGGKLNSFSTAADSREERPAAAAAGAVAEHLGNAGCLCLGFPARAYVSACANIALQPDRSVKLVEIFRMEPHLKAICGRSLPSRRTLYS